MVALGPQGWARLGCSGLGMCWGESPFQKAVRPQHGARGAEGLGKAHSAQVPGSCAGVGGAIRTRTLPSGSMAFWESWKTFLDNYNTKPTEQSVNIC